MSTIISLEEKRKIQLDMLEEIHNLCIGNNLRYSLSCGTLLGAIRHKGFIPWDDDLDIMMPLPDMLKLKELLKSARVMYADVDTCPHFEYGFSRIIHRKTYLKVGRFSKSYGINIDLYPVTSIPSTDPEKELYFQRGEKIFHKRIKYLGLRRRIIKLLPITTIPIFDIFFDRSMRNYRDFMLKECLDYGTSKCYHIWSGAITNRKIHLFSKDLFDQMIITPFENRNFMITSKYDEYLTHTFGNYMQLPPEEERVPYHGGDYYWK